MRLLYVSLIKLSVLFFAYANSHCSVSPDYFNTRFFVTNSENNILSQVDVIARITETMTATGSFPTFVAITPDGKKAYVTDQNAGTVTPIYLTITPPAAGANIATGATPYGIAITPDGSRVYVTNAGDFVHPGIVSIIRTADDTVITNLLVPPAPVDIAIMPDGTKALVTHNQAANNVTLIDLTTNTVYPPLTVGNGPYGISITPDGATAYIANFGSLVTNDGFGNTVIPLNLSTLQVGTPIHVGQAPIAIAITADGKKAYVTNSGAGNGHTVTPINLKTNRAGHSIPVEKGPVGIATTADGRYAYVANFGALPGSGHTVTPIRLETDSSEAPISVGNGPIGIAVAPDQAPTALFSVNTGEVGTPTYFDASASFSPVGYIVSYMWNFGDGTPIVTTSCPTISHIYRTASTYTVSLTVTNLAGTSTTQVFTGHTVLRNGGASAFATQTITILPTYFIGKVITNKFATQTEYIYRLEGKANPNPLAITYQLFRNGRLIKQFSARTSFVYKDRPKNGKRVQYTLVALDAAGNTVNSASIILP